MVDSDGSTAYEYDAGGRLTWVSYPIGQSLSYSYDAAGNRIGMGSAQGITSYDYDAQDRLTAVTNPYSETTELHYDALDREVRKELANGVVISHTYDAAGRETVLEQRQSTGVAISIYTTTYDNVGNRTHVQELDGATVAYSYDNTYQLLSETRSGSNVFSTAFTYDGLGNRLTETKDSVLTSYTYDANNAVTTAITGAAVTTFTYDQNGNRTGIDEDGTTTAYSWNAENRMVGVVNPDSNTESFAYSGDGQRRRKTTDAEEVLYLWDGENVLAELNTGGGLIAQYTDNPGYRAGLTSLHLEGGSSAFNTPLGGMGAFNTVEFNQEQASGGSREYYYLFDLSANTRYLVDSDEEVTDSELYRAFGESITHTGSTRNPYRFQGEVGPYTDAVNQIWMRARSYDSMAGQWYSTDPIEFEGGSWNIYLFVGNNPVNTADPYGLSPMSLDSPHGKVNEAMRIAVKDVPTALSTLQTLQNTSTVSERDLAIYIKRVEFLETNAARYVRFKDIKDLSRALADLPNKQNMALSQFFKAVLKDRNQLACKQSELATKMPNDLSHEALRIYVEISRRVLNDPKMATEAAQKSQYPRILVIQKLLFPGPR